jgi:DNA polymerase-3 subunit delta'
VGISTAAHWLAQQLAAHSSDISTIQPDGSSISIDQIRQLYSQTRGRRQTPLVIVVDDADTMGDAAQNALLKLLEEPPAQVHLILTAHQPQQLLPTIHSRVVSHEIMPINREQTAQLLDQLAVSDPARRAQLQFLASGQPAELTRLASDADYFTAMVERITAARSYLQADRLQRLIIGQQWGSQRDKAISFVRLLGRLVDYGSRQNMQPSHIQALELINETLDALARNGNGKVHLLRLSWKLTLH